MSRDQRELSENLRNQALSRDGSDVGLTRKVIGISEDEWGGGQEGWRGECGN